MKNLRVIFATVVLVLVSQLVFADGAPPPPGVPLDGGVTLLIGAAVAYGIKESLKSKKDV